MNAPFLPFDAASKETFREAMTYLTSAVNVITSDGPSGKIGFTASAVCSVSDTPPMLLVCMNRNSAQNQPLKENGVLAVNSLCADGERLARIFAGQTTLQGEERFEDQLWTTMVTGSPKLKEAAVTFDCRISEVKEVATHSIFFCEVQAASMLESSSALAYFRRAFHSVKLTRI